MWLPRKVVLLACSLLAMAGCEALVQPGSACDPGLCLGCCDASGLCTTPSAAACGVEGSACVACGLNELCTAGRCRPREGMTLGTTSGASTGTVSTTVGSTTGSGSRSTATSSTTGSSTTGSTTTSSSTVSTSTTSTSTTSSGGTLGSGTTGTTSTSSTSTTTSAGTTSTATSTGSSSTSSTGGTLGTIGSATGSSGSRGSSGGSSGSTGTPIHSPLLFSEYLEASGDNKAIELFNPSSAEVALRGHRIDVVFNGAVDAGLANRTFTFTQGNPRIAARGTYVICHGSGFPNEPSDFCDFRVNAITSFNGDDSLVLIGPDGQVADVFGDGTDPGLGWGPPDPFTFSPWTAEHDLRRSCSVTVGRSSFSPPWDPTREWSLFAGTDASDLGQHACP